MSSQAKAGLSRMASLCMLLLTSSALSQYTYVEGTDTTDVAGKGMDGLFTVHSYSIEGAAVVYGSGGYGYLNCTFDELQKVPDSIRSCSNSVDNPIGHCFIVSASSNNTWAKIQVTRQLPDKRFVYRYGQNRTPDNKLLVSPNYDRQRIYRPNNIHWSEVYRRNDEFVMEVTLTWEPPISCSKQVTGYLVYGASQPIDTAKPINIKEWERVGIPSGNMLKFKAGPLYLNVVAVYPGDTSEFSGAFTRMEYPISIIPYQPQYDGSSGYPPVSVPLTPPMPLCTFDGRCVSVKGLSGGRAAGVYMRSANAKRVLTIR